MPEIEYLLFEDPQAQQEVYYNLYPQRYHFRTNIRQGSSH